MVEILRAASNNVPFVSGNQKVLFIDNQDSFSFNLINYICTCSDAKVKVVGNDITIDEIKAFKPDKIVIGPGPGHPKYETGNVIKIIQEFHSKIPIFGICLGHQAMCEAFGEKTDVEYVGRAKVGPKHGKMSKIFHCGDGIFKDLPNPTSVVRYHSLAAKADLLPEQLKIISMAEDGTIMAVQHKEYPTFGVQFHPESIMMRPHGMVMISNFLQLNLVH